MKSIFHKVVYTYCILLEDNIDAYFDQEVKSNVSLFTIPTPTLTFWPSIYIYQKYPTFYDNGVMNFMEFRTFTIPDYF